MMLHASILLAIVGKAYGAKKDYSNLEATHVAVRFDAPDLGTQDPDFRGPRIMTMSLIHDYYKGHPIVANFGGAQHAFTVEFTDRQAFRPIDFDVAYPDYRVMLNSDAPKSKICATCKIKVIGDHDRSVRIEVTTRGTGELYRHGKTEDTWNRKFTGSVTLNERQWQAYTRNVRANPKAALQPFHKLSLTGTKGESGSVQYFCGNKNGKHKDPKYDNRAKPYCSEVFQPVKGMYVAPRKFMKLDEKSVDTCYVETSEWKHVKFNLCECQEHAHVPVHSTRRDKYVPVHNAKHCHETCLWSNMSPPRKLVMRTTEEKTNV